MIELNEIHKQFGDHVVLDGINLKVNQGEVITLIGPSGTGKTTLLRSINLLERFDSGSITIDNLSIDARTKDTKQILKLRRKTAMVFQQFNLFRNLKVIDNVIQPQVVVHKIDKNLAKKTAEELLQRVGLLDFANQYPSQLSGGQKQRVSIARALALNPEIILFDDPTSALDPELSSEVLDVIKKIVKTGITIVLATHEMKFAEEISDRVIFMENGNIIDQGSAEYIFHESKNVRTRKFLSRYSNKYEDNVPQETQKLEKLRVI